MDVLSLFVYAAMGAALAWAGIALLQRMRRRKLHCITPYVPARERNTRPTPKP